MEVRKYEEVFLRRYEPKPAVEGMCAPLSCIPSESSTAVPVRGYCKDANGADSSSGKRLGRSIHMGYEDVHSPADKPGCAT